MTTTRTSYGRQLRIAMERARLVTTAAEIPVAARRAEIIDLALQGLTVPELRAYWVAHLSGAPLPRGASRARVVEALRTKILASLEA